MVNSITHPSLRAPKFILPGEQAKNGRLWQVSYAKHISGTRCCFVLRSDRVAVDLTEKSGLNDWMLALRR
jgi:hypothetical protein